MGRCGNWRRLIYKIYFSAWLRLLHEDEGEVLATDREDQGDRAS